jgi:hypothetical protein
MAQPAIDALHASAHSSTLMATAVATGVPLAHRAPEASV